MFEFVTKKNGLMKVKKVNKVLNENILRQILLLEKKGNVSLSE